MESVAARRQIAIDGGVVGGRLVPVLVNSFEPVLVENALLVGVLEIGELEHDVAVVVAERHAQSLESAVVAIDQQAGNRRGGRRWCRLIVGIHLDESVVGAEKQVSVVEANGRALAEDIGKRTAGKLVVDNAARGSVQARQHFFGAHPQLALTVFNQTVDAVVCQSVLTIIIGVLPLSGFFPDSQQSPVGASSPHRAGAVGIEADETAGDTVRRTDGTVEHEQAFLGSHPKTAARIAQGIVHTAATQQRLLTAVGAKQRHTAFEHRHNQAAAFVGSQLEDVGRGKVGHPPAVAPEAVAAGARPQSATVIAQGCVDTVVVVPRQRSLARRHIKVVNVAGLIGNQQLSVARRSDTSDVVDVLNGRFPFEPQCVVLQTVDGQALDS